VGHSINEILSQKEASVWNPVDGVFRGSLRPAKEAFLQNADDQDIARRNEDRRAFRDFIFNMMGS